MSKYMEEHKFNTEEAALAFCRVHTEFSPVTFGGTVAGAGLGRLTIADACVTWPVTPDTLELVELCKLSYKNIVIAEMISSLTNKEYRMGNYEISHPVIFTYAIGVAAPVLTLWFLVTLLISLMLGTGIPIYSTLMFIVMAFSVEVLIPWINKYSVDPIQEPWMIPNILDNIKNANQ